VSPSPRSPFPEPKIKRKNIATKIMFPMDGRRIGRSVNFEWRSWIGIEDAKQTLLHPTGV